jgi:hypothetical protein
MIKNSIMFYEILNLLNTKSITLNKIIVIYLNKVNFDEIYNCTIFFLDLYLFVWQLDLNATNWLIYTMIFTTNDYILEFFLISSIFIYLKQKRDF